MPTLTRTAKVIGAGTIIALAVATTTFRVGIVGALAVAAVGAVVIATLVGAMAIHRVLDAAGVAERLATGELGATVEQPGHWLVGRPETARLVRAALRDAFPSGRFSVRSHTYAGGGAIDVRYSDGPSIGAVHAVTDPFAGGGFDGSIDMAYNVSAYVLDGRIVGHSSPGTTGSGGYHSRIDDVPPAGARRVSFGANHIFVARELSDAAKSRIATALVAKYGPDVDWTDYSAGWTRHALRVATDELALPFGDPAARDYGDLGTFVNRARDFDLLVG